MKVQKTKLNTGIQIEYSLSGAEGEETILFGLGPNLRQFGPQQRFFAHDHRPLLVSLRGHGNSSGPLHPTRADYTVRELALDVQALLSHLGIGKVHFVGNSLGGLVGYELLELDADRVSSLTTFGTTAELHAPQLLRWSQLSLIRLLGPRGMAWLVGKTASKDKAIAARVGRMCRMVSKDALALIASNIADYDYTGVIRRHDVPMMLIKGGLDGDINANLDSTLAALWKCSARTLYSAGSSSGCCTVATGEAFRQQLERLCEEAK